MQKIKAFIPKTCNMIKSIKLFTIAFLITGFSAFGNAKNQTMEDKNYPEPKQQMAVSLTFQKYNAEEAMNFYVDLFDHARIIDISRWGEDGPGKEGTVMMAIFEINGMRFLCSDSPPIHNWDFSPAVSIYVDGESEEEVKRIFNALAEGGTVAMPLNNYGFSTLFGWVIDRFGVSWQLNFE